MEKLTEEAAVSMPLPNEPLPISVTEPARENLILRVLIQQAIPMLKHPEAYGRDARCSLAQTLTKALGCDPAEERAEDDLSYAFAEPPEEMDDGCEEVCPYDSCEMPWE